MESKEEKVERFPFVRTEGQVGRAGCAPHFLLTGKGARGWTGMVGGWRREASEEVDVAGGKGKMRR